MTFRSIFNYRLQAVICVLFSIGGSLPAQTAVFHPVRSNEEALLRTLHLPAAGFQPYHLLRTESSHQSTASAVQFTTSRQQFTYLHPTRLPWSEECLPFFCRIEHQWGKNKALPVKFRLGSVEYVDWLEGKSRSSTFEP